MSCLVHMIQMRTQQISLYLPFLGNDSLPALRFFHSTINAIKGPSRGRLTLSCGGGPVVRCVKTSVRVERRASWNNDPSLGFGEMLAPKRCVCVSGLGGVDTSPICGDKMARLLCNSASRYRPPVSASASIGVVEC